MGVVLSEATGLWEYGYNTVTVATLADSQQLYLQAHIVWCHAVICSWRMRWRQQPPSHSYRVCLFMAACSSDRASHFGACASAFCSGRVPFWWMLLQMHSLGCDLLGLMVLLSACYAACCLFLAPAGAQTQTRTHLWRVGGKTNQRGHCQ